jgi:hypothetical protein
MTPQELFDYQVSVILKQDAAYPFEMNIPFSAKYDAVLQLWTDSRKTFVQHERDFAVHTQNERYVLHHAAASKKMPEEGPLHGSSDGLLPSPRKGFAPSLGKAQPKIIDHPGSKLTPIFVRDDEMEMLVRELQSRLFRGLREVQLLVARSVVTGNRDFAHYKAARDRRAAVFYAEDAKKKNEYVSMGFPVIAIHEGTFRILQEHEKRRLALERERDNVSWATSGAPLLTSLSNVTGAARMRPVRSRSRSAVFQRAADYGVEFLNSRHSLSVQETEPRQPSARRPSSQRSSARRQSISSRRTSFAMPSDSERAKNVQPTKPSAATAGGNH